MTQPLQASFAIKLAKAIAQSRQPILLLNGCYPGAVNAVRKALGLPVFCGIGNIAVITASLQAALGIRDRRRLLVLAHHIHLSKLCAHVDEAQAWVDERNCPEVSDLLRLQRASDGLQVNKLTGFTASVLLRDILNERMVSACVPGSLGLPGGYPVLIQGSKLTLNLPDHVSLSAATDWNQKCAAGDGVQVQPHGYYRILSTGEEGNLKLYS